MHDRRRRGTGSVHRAPVVAALGAVGETVAAAVVASEMRSRPGLRRFERSPRTGGEGLRSDLASLAEATALGNILVQARAFGAMPSSLEAMRERVASSLSLRRYEPT